MQVTVGRTIPPLEYPPAGPPYPAPYPPPMIPLPKPGTVPTPGMLKPPPGLKDPPPVAPLEFFFSSAEKGEAESGRAATAVSSKTAMRKPEVVFMSGFVFGGSETCEE